MNKHPGVYTETELLLGVGQKPISQSKELHTLGDIGPEFRKPIHFFNHLNTVLHES